MLRRYERDNQKYGSAWYEISFNSRRSVVIDIDRGYNQDFQLTIGTDDDVVTFAASDEEMQEFVLAYLAVKKEIEEG